MDWINLLWAAMRLGSNGHLVTESITQREHSLHIQRPPVFPVCEAQASNLLKNEMKTPHHGRHHRFRKR